MFEAIIYEKSDDGIATLTFNRPEAMNAGNQQLYGEMRQAIDDYENDDAMRVLILTGAGKGFHAGDDVKEMFKKGDELEKIMTWGLTKKIRGEAVDHRIPEFIKPTIAAVNGPAIGMGMDISLLCDFRIASEGAKFGYFYVRRGIIGTDIGPVRLPHIVGLPRALEIMLSGELVDAREAERIGLVRNVVSQDKLMDEAKALARKLMRGAPLAQVAIRRAVHKALHNPDGITKFTMDLLTLLSQTEDLRESTKAVIEKREPVFKAK